MLITDISPNAAILYSNTVPVTTGDEAMALIIALEREMEKIGNAAGLAAPQIGEPRSVAIVRLPNISINLINPSIISVSDPFIHKGEGCKSLGCRRFNVPRFKHITIKNYALWPSPSGAIPLEDDPNKKPINRFNPPKGLFLVPVEQTYVYDLVEEEYGGIVCVAVQHEEEHLRGKTINRKEGSVEVPSSADPKWKVGRNDPCPCGAKNADGKAIKFKKCCLVKMEG